MMNMMNKYAVSLIRPVTATVKVEASTEAEAVTKALIRANTFEEVFPWDTQAVQVIGTQLIARADPDAAKMEAMLNVLRNSGFEVEEKREYYISGGKLVGYKITGKTPETEMSMSHKIDCSAYAEGLTAENFFTEWQRDINSFDPAWEVVETIADLDVADAAKCLRDMLEDCDSYAYVLRSVTAKMQKAMADVDKKEES